MTGNQIGLTRIFDDDMGKINYLHHKYIGEQNIQLQIYHSLQTDGE